MVLLDGIVQLFFNVGRIFGRTESQSSGNTLIVRVHCNGRFRVRPLFFQPVNDLIYVRFIHNSFNGDWQQAELFLKQ